MAWTPCMNALEQAQLQVGGTYRNWIHVSPEQTLQPTLMLTVMMMVVMMISKQILRFDVWTFKMVPNYILCQANPRANKNFLVHLKIMFYGCVPCCKYCSFMSNVQFVVIHGVITKLQFRPGVQKFSKNLGATSKFQVQEGCLEASSKRRTHKYYVPLYNIQQSQ